MTHRKGAIWTERVLLALILGSLIGSLNLIVALNRRSASQPASRDANSTLAEPSPTVSSQPIAQSAAPISSSPKDEKPADSAIVQKPAEPIPPPPPAVDPTKKILASLTSATAQEIEASRLADRRSEALEEARQAAVAESRKWKRRDLLVRQQIASLNNRAEELETSASILDAERDVLAHERDALKAALSKASRRSGFAVLPYKGPNGTWRRPIVLECTSGGVKLQPQGLNFTMLELSPYLHPRSSPFVRAVAHELLHIQSSDTPDGAPVVPYLVFLVRPDGIRPYYEARSRLEPLGIAFGYELIEQELSVDIPDFDNLTTWDGSVPLDMALEGAPQSKSKVAMLSTAARGTSETSTGSSNWPGGDRSSPGGSGGGSNPRGRQAGADSANPESSTPDDFVWPSRPRQTAERDLPGPGSAGMGPYGDLSKGTSSGYSGTKLGSDQPGGFGDRDANSSSFSGQQPSSGRASSHGDLAKLGDLNPPANAAGTMRFPGNGSGSSSAIPGGGPAQRQAQQPWGSGSGLAGAGDLSSLPDLEPAGDTPSSQPVRSQGGSSLGQSSSAGKGGLQSFNLGGGQAGGGAASTGGVSSLGQSSSAGIGGGQSFNLGGGQASGGATSTGGFESSNSNTSAGGQMLGFAPYQGAAGGASAAGSGSTLSDGGGMGQSSVLARGSGGGGPTTGSSNGTVSVASDLPSLPQSQNVGTPADNQLPGAGPNTGGGSVTTSDASNLPPQGSNVASGSASGSSSGTSTGSSGQVSNTGSSSISSSPTTTGSSSSTSPTISSSTSASGGMSLGSMSSSGTPSVSMPAFTFGQNSGSASDSSKQTAVPPPPKPSPTMGMIEVPFEIVVVCRERDLLLHPGGYRLTTQAMKEHGGGKDGLLVREIRALVLQRAQVDPMIRPRPKITFLVESNGSETFWTARRQLLFSLSDWPMSLQVAESQSVHVFNKETW